MKNKINQKRQARYEKCEKKERKHQMEYRYCQPEIALLLMAGGVRIHKLKEEKYELQNG